ncbi:uncharacterized protein ACO6RY_11352 [Pungitius sinensis]
MAEPAAEPVLEQAPEQEPAAELESGPQEESVEASEPEREAEAPEPELEQLPEPEPEKVLQPEPEQVADAIESAAEEQVGEFAPEPIKVTEVTEVDNAEAESVSVELVATAAEKVPTDYQPVEEESVPSTEEAPEPEAAEPVPQIVISESVSATEITADSEEVAEAPVEEVSFPEPEEENKMENGDIKSPSGTEDVVEVDAHPAVNGECTHSSAPQIEGCVNGNEKEDEMPIKEQSDSELKKEANLSGDVRDVPDAVSDMADGLSTEITQAV